MFKFKHLRTEYNSIARVKIPDHDRHFPAVLRYTPDKGIELEVFDIEQDFFKSLQRATEPNTPRIDQIHGEMVNGQRFTLFECFERGGPSSTSGIGASTYHANRMVAGWTILDEEKDKIVRCLHTRFTMLDVWMDRCTVELANSGFKPNDPNAWNMARVQRAKDFEFHAPSTGITLRSTQQLNFDRKILAVTVYNEPYLTLEFDQPASCAQARDESFRLQCLFSLLCGKQSHSEILMLTAATDEQRDMDARAYYFGNSAYESRDSIRRPEQLLTCLSRVEGVLGTVWANWQERIDKYIVPVQLHASPTIFGGQLLDFQYLSAVQALEVLHRNLTGDDKCRLLHRLESMCDSLSHELQQSLHPNLKSIVAKVKDTRHNLTHSRQHENGFSRSEIAYATPWLRWVFTAWILHDLGVPADLLASCLNDSAELKWFREHMPTA